MEGNRRRSTFLVHRRNKAEEIEGEKQCSRATEMRRGRDREASECCVVASNYKLSIFLVHRINKAEEIEGEK